MKENWENSHTWALSIHRKQKVMLSSVRQWGHPWQITVLYIYVVYLCILGEKDSLGAAISRFSPTNLIRPPKSLPDLLKKSPMVIDNSQDLQLGDDDKYTFKIGKLLLFLLVEQRMKRSHISTRIPPKHQELLRCLFKMLLHSEPLKESGICYVQV